MMLHLLLCSKSLRNSFFLHCHWNVICSVLKHAVPGKVENVTTTVTLSTGGPTVKFSFQVSKQQKMPYMEKDSQF